MGVSHTFPEGLDTRVLGGAPPFTILIPCFHLLFLNHVIAQALHTPGVDLGALSS